MRGAGEISAPKQVNELRLINFPYGPTDARQMSQLTLQQDAVIQLQRDQLGQRQDLVVTGATHDVVDGDLARVREASRLDKFMHDRLLCSWS